MTDLACNLLNITSVPLYETLGFEMVNLILIESEMTTIFGTSVCLKSILTSSKGSKNQVKTIVSFDPIDADLTQQAESLGLTLRYYSDLLAEIGDNFEVIDGSKNSLDTIFTISYTSGTSGNSKGVMLSNRNFLSAFTNILHLANIFKF